MTLTMASFGAANGIEEIDADKHVGVIIAGDDADNVLDFSATSLVGIAEINGGKGHDTITGSAADDRIIGGNGYDRFDGGAGADTLDGGSGVDTLIGGAGNDVLLGGALGDRLEGGTGNDFLDGGAGSDTYLVGSGDGFDIYQDSGTDGAFDWILVTSDNVTLTMASFGLATGIEQINAGGHAGVTIVGDANVLDFSETVQLTTLVGIAEINGGAGDDAITGSASDDRIVGGTGHDVLAGGLGDDTLEGGAGNEVLIGGAGSDTFVFTSSFDGDKIVDFQVGEDVIEFSTKVFADYAAVQAASSQIGADVEIAFGDNSITLYNVQLAMLSAQDFLFV